jgi:hypothetical protein
MHRLGVVEIDLAVPNLVIIRCFSSVVQVLLGNVANSCLDVYSLPAASRLAIFYVASLSLTASRVTFGGFYPSRTPVCSLLARDTDAGVPQCVVRFCAEANSGPFPGMGRSCCLDRFPDARPAVFENSDQRWLSM